MTRIFFMRYPPAPLWKWHWRNSETVAGAFSRRLVTFWDAQADQEPGDDRFEIAHLAAGDRVEVTGEFFG